MKTDALNRRSRFAKPQPLDLKLITTERDLAIYRALDRHGKLSTNYLYELTRDFGQDYSFLQKRLTQLYNGYCTHPDHKSENKDGHVCKPITFLTRDAPQFNNFEARYQPLVYGLTPLARKILEDNGTATLKFRRSNSFIHDFFLSCFTASLELKAKRFIFRDEILKKAGADKAAFNDLVPDDIFGIELEEGGFRFFALEIDRATMRVNTTDYIPSSIEKKIAGYENILDGGFKSLVPNLTVLFATTSEARVQTMLASVEGKRWAHKFRFKHFDDFGENWRVPRETLNVFEGWQSTKGEQDISKRV